MSIILTYRDNRPVRHRVDRFLYCSQPSSSTVLRFRFLSLSSSLSLCTWTRADTHRHTHTISTLVSNKKIYSWQYFQSSQNEWWRTIKRDTKEQLKHEFKPIYYLLQLNILFLYYRGPFETIQIICAVINNCRIFPKRHAKNNNIISHQKNPNVDILICMTLNPCSPSASVFLVQTFPRGDSRSAPSDENERHLEGG